MADLQAELARFEAELAGSSAPPRPPPGNVAPNGLPGPPTLTPPHPQTAHQPPAWSVPANRPQPSFPAPAAMPAAPAYGYAAQPAAAAGYYAPGRAANYGYAQGGVDSKAELLTGIKAAFEQQKVAKKPKVGVARQAAGKRWIDPNLVEWPENDFRIFVGDLGNETNDDVLTKAFNKHPTFQKAKVVRDKKTNKTKGFGFVSFGDPIEGAKALREMDGKYIGNRPCKLHKSTWQERSQESQPFIPGGGRKKNHIGGVAKRTGFLHK